MRDPASDVSNVVYKMHAMMVFGKRQNTFMMPLTEP
jgi:hypothetical protein